MYIATTCTNAKDNIYFGFNFFTFAAIFLNFINCDTIPSK